MATHCEGYEGASWGDEERSMVDKGGVRRDGGSIEEDMDVDQDEHRQQQQQLRRQ